MTSEQQKATDNYRSAIEKSVENDEQIGRYGNSPNGNRTEAERLQERGRQLDEDEAAARSANTHPMIGKMTTTPITIMMNQTMTMAAGRRRTTEIWTGEEELCLENE